MRKLMTADYILKAKSVHGERYDYSKTKYTTQKNKIEITCRDHGAFLMLPNNHLKPQNCPYCSGMIYMDTDGFILKSKAIHGDNYLYSSSIYSGMRELVKIECREHGFFQQTASTHLKGHGCADCSGNKAMTTDIFISRSIEKHGVKYRYSQTKYTSARLKVLIECPDHGFFSQTASAHLSGKGCKICSGYKVSNTETFIAEANSVHNSTYTYPNAEYTKSSELLKITCAEHGDFEQSPNKHLQGRGCPRCLWDRDQPTDIYLMQMGAQVKIGISIDPDTRLAQLNRNNPKPANIITTWTLEDFPTAHAMEQRIHRKLKLYHAGLSGFDGATEWFNTTPEHAEQVVNKVISSHAANHHHATIASTPQLALF